MRNIRNIRNIRNLRGKVSPKAGDFSYLLDGVDDYVINTGVLGRTGYDMNVYGNVSTGSDAGGNYILINGNKDATTGSKAGMGPAALVYNQGTSFSFKVKAKFNTLAASSTSGLFGADVDAAIYYDYATNSLRWVLRGSTTVGVPALATASTGVMYDAYFVYDHTTTRFYCYLSTAGASSVLQNTGGTVGPATFSTSNWYIGDDGIGAGTAVSCNKQVYHTAIWNRALTQAEIDADIALGNTAKTDTTIVAYYIPDNLAFNSQYSSFPIALGNAAWVKSGATTVTDNTTVAPDGTTTADTINISGTATQGITATRTNLTGATLSSKTFIIKAFMKVAAGTGKCRLNINHDGVASYLSSDITVTTDWTEYTFTQTFTSATGGTGFSFGIVNDTTASNSSIIAWNVVIYQSAGAGGYVLWDESPNMAGYIGWKTPTFISANMLITADSTDTSDAGAILVVPWFYIHLRASNNQFLARYDNALAGHQSNGGALGNGFRTKVNLAAYKYWDGTNRILKVYKNGILLGTTTITQTAKPPTTNYTNVGQIGRKGTTYFASYMWDARAYTGSITDADAAAIARGGEPATAIKRLQWRPGPTESGTSAVDWSGNGNTGNVIGGILRKII